MLVCTGSPSAPKLSCAPRSGPRVSRRECDSSATARRAICRHSTRARLRSCFLRSSRASDPLLEAMWCDCPIVCSNTTSLPEIAGDAALLVDPRSPEDLARDEPCLDRRRHAAGADRAWAAAGQRILLAGVHAGGCVRPSSSANAPQRIGLSMAALPRISIVTACLEPTASLVETVESVVRQGYANLEHFIVTGGSRDDISGRIARHPQQQVALVVDPGQGRASALSTWAFPWPPAQSGRSSMPGTACCRERWMWRSARST